MRLEENGYLHPKPRGILPFLLPAIPLAEKFRRILVAFPLASVPLAALPAVLPAALPAATVREMLIASGLPYVIENVEGAPLIDPVVLCGTMFPGLRVLRHRLFEANFEITPPEHKKHPKVHTFDRRKSHYGKTDEWKDFVQITGGGNCTLAAARDAMGIDWMTKGEINEAIPPAYAEFVGKQMLHAVALRRPLA